MMDSAMSARECDLCRFPEISTKLRPTDDGLTYMCNECWQDYQFCNGGSSYDRPRP